MRPRLTQMDILSALVNETHETPDHPIRDITTGVCLAAVTSRFLGLASLATHIAPGLPRQDDRDGTPSGVHEAAALLLDPATTNTDKASLAMAAINSLLPPPRANTAVAGQDILFSRGRGKKVAVVGHFPFVGSLREVCDTVWVLEKRPQAGDIEASKAGEILPRADLVAVTGTTLLNGTLAGLLNDCRPDALVIMIGPTTPYAKALFECGIDVLAGCAVSDPEAALSGIRAGHCFKGLSGVVQTAWSRPGFAD